MKQAIETEFDRLVRGLRQHESIRNVEEDREGQVAKALQWLKSNQRPGGYWGEHCMLDTQMSLLALAFWKDGETEWALLDGSSGGVASAFEWLKTFQAESPAWDNNLWDTSAIVQAAARFGFLGRDSIIRAKHWIEERERDKWGLDSGSGVHYLAQATMAMVACESPPELIARARDLLLAETRRPLARENWTPYAAGQVLSALVVAGANPAEATVRQLAEELLKFLLRAEITIANWLHLCSAFRGLGLSLGTPSLEHPELQRSIQRLFSPNRVRADGSWYRDITMTAWALVALESIRTVRKIDTYSFAIFSSVEQSRITLLQASDEAHKSRALLFWYGALVPLLAMALACIVYLVRITSTDVFKDRDILFFVLPGILGVAGFIIKRVWSLMRNR